MSAASIISSVVTGGSNSHQTVSEELNSVATDFVTQGIVGGFTTGSPNTGAFAVTQDASPDMGVTVLLGRAYVAGTPASQDAQVFNARMTSNYTSYTINSNSSGSTKYDWIYLSFNATNAANPSSAGDNVITLFTSRSTSNASDTGSPPTYGFVLGVVTVANGASSITNANIGDKRIQTSFNAGASSTNNGWTNLPYPLTYGANNGSKEFTVTTPNNATGVLSSGMKLQVTRSVSPPTQCMAFASASSQYATKSSPSGITFTGSFTCEAWIYPLSYTGQNQFIISRSDNSTQGFGLRLNSVAQLDIFYGGSSNFTDISTYQSISLNQWTHVAVAVNASAKTAVTYINGASVSNQVTVSSATAVTQGANLTVGGVSTGVANTYFNGYISEARVWSVAQTQSAIQSNMAINLVGNETNLVSLFQGNGNFTDATSNANTLTATGGAIATQAANPYSLIEYANIRAVSYSNPTTTITLYTSDIGTIPNQTLNTPEYSINKEPYGLPEVLNSKILAQIIWCANITTTATSSGTVLNGATASMTIPTTGKKLLLKIYTPELQPSAGIGVLDLFWGANRIGQADVASSVAVNGQTVPFWATSGSQTFSIGMWQTSAGTCTFNAATVAPACFTIEET